MTFHMKYVQFRQNEFKRARFVDYRENLLLFSASLFSFQTHLVSRKDYLVSFLFTFRLKTLLPARQLHVAANHVQAQDGHMS